jgi:hypothetical protein
MSGLGGHKQRHTNTWNKASRKTQKSNIKNNCILPMFDVLDT